MKYLSLLLILTTHALAIDANRIADAIYKVEGGSKAKAPYGILSIRVSSTDDARRICTNTIRNNHNRWIRAGRPGEYLDFLAWKRNIRKISGLDF